MINRVVVIGRLVSNPELKITQAGVSYVRVTIANEQAYKDKKHTNFIDVLAWSGLAENLSKYCEKGRKILVDGRLEIKKNKQGETTYVNTTIIAENIDFLENPKHNENPDYMEVNNENVEF